MESLNQQSLGIKSLDAENWLEPDKASMSFAYLSTNGEPHPMVGDDWGRVFLGPQLSTSCPKDVVVAFEAARGALVYGWFFYPLYALAQRELLDVAELAVRLRCQQLGMPKGRTKAFADQTSALLEAGELTDEEARSWARLRKVRNSLVHADSATITMPGSSARILGRVAELTNALYAE